MSVLGEKFVFYSSWMKMIEALPQEQGNKLLRAIVDYGCYYELPDINDDAVVYAMLQAVIPQIETQKTNYENASKGGRPIKATQEDFNKLFDKGMKNVDIAEELQVSTKTVERRKKVWTEQKEREKEKDTDREKDKEKDIDKDRVGFVGFVGSDSKSNIKDFNGSRYINNNGNIIEISQAAAELGF